MKNIKTEKKLCHVISGNCFISTYQQHKCHIVVMQNPVILGKGMLDAEHLYSTAKLEIVLSNILSGH